MRRSVYASSCESLPRRGFDQIPGGVASPGAALSAVAELLAACFISVNAAASRSRAPNIVAPVSAMSGTGSARGRARRRLKRIDRIADGALYAVCVAGALVVVLVMVDIAEQLLHGGQGAISRFGLPFLTHTAWKPNFK